MMTRERELLDALHLIDMAYRLAERSTPANLRRAILDARRFTQSRVVTPGGRPRDQRLTPPCSPKETEVSSND